MVWDACEKETETIMFVPPGGELAQLLQGQMISSQEEKVLEEWKWLRGVEIPRRAYCVELTHGHYQSSMYNFLTLGSALCGGGENV